MRLVRDTGASGHGQIHRASGILNKRLFHIAIICLLGLIVYSNTFHVPFQWDGNRFIRGNPAIKDLSFFVHPSHVPVQYYMAVVERYIGYLTFALNYKISGFNVTSYHIFNIAVHLFTAVLVYLLVTLTFRTPYFSGHSAKSIEHGVIDKDRRQDKEESSPLNVSGDPPLSPLNLRGDRGGLQPAVQDSRSASFIALFAALLFVSHPVQIEAVTYIFQRLASLAAMFYLLSIVFYIKGRLGWEGRQVSKQKAARVSNPPSSPLNLRGERAGVPLKSEGERGGGVPLKLRGNRAGLWPLVYLILSLVFAVLAMKTKENAFTLPIIIILYEFLFFDGSIRKRALFLVPLSLTLLIIPVTLLSIAGVSVNPYDTSLISFRHIPRWDYLLTQARVLITYIRLFFLPFHQNLDYDYPVFHSVLNPEVFLSAFFLIILFGIAVYLIYRSKWHNPPSDSKLKIQDSRFKYYRLIAFGIFWFFITLSVESSLQPIPQIIDEYRMYLPMAGMALAAATGLLLLARQFGRKKAGLALAVAAFLFTAAFSVTAYQRNSVWETQISLWSDTAAKSPWKPTVHGNLGTAYYTAGELDKAIRQYEISLRLNPFYKETYINICYAYAAKNLPDPAIKYCNTATSLYPGDARLHYELGRMYFHKGLIDDARGQIEIVLQLKPDSHRARRLLEEINKGSD